MEVYLKKTKLMSWKRYNGVDVSCSCDVYVLNVFFRVTLIYLKMMMMSTNLSVFAFPSSLVTWKDCVKGQFPHCPLKVAWQRLPLQWSNLSFSHYYCLPLFGTSNRDQFLKYLIQNLNFINQSLPRFDKIWKTQIVRAPFTRATRKRG